MPQDKPQKPMMTNEQKEIICQSKELHEQRMQIDPEYRALWGKREQDLRRFIFPEYNTENQDR